MHPSRCGGIMISTRSVGLNLPRFLSCDVSLSLPLAPKPNIRCQRHEARCPRRPQSLTVSSSESLLDFGCELVLSISPVPRSGRCPVTKRIISHGGESGGARIRIAHGFIILRHIMRNLCENGWQESNIPLRNCTVPNMKNLSLWCTLA